VVRNKIGNGTNEDRAVVHALSSGEVHTKLTGQLMQMICFMTNLLGFLLNLDVKLVQGLNVVGCECNGNQADILVTSLR